MTQQKGSNAKIIYGTETTFKTAASDAHVLPFTSESFKMSRNLLDSATIRGSRQPIAPARGNVEITGDVTVELDPYMGRMLYHALGTFSTSGSNPYSHTFRISDLPAGLTIEKQFTDLATDSYMKYMGCKVNSMKIAVKQEGFVETTFSFMGATHTLSASSIDASPTDYTTSAVGGIFDGFEASLENDGANIAIVTNFDVTIENNLDGSVYVIGSSGDRYSLPDGLVKVSGNITCLFENTTMYNKAVNNNESSLRVTLTHLLGTGAAYNEKFDLFLDELLFAPNSPVVNGPNGIMVELPFTAYYKDGSRSSALAIVLWNTQTNVDVQG